MRWTSYSNDGFDILYLMSKDIGSKIVKEEVIYEGKWLGLKYVDFTIGEKTVNNYEAVYRPQRKKSGSTMDGV